MTTRIPILIALLLTVAATVTGFRATPSAGVEPVEPTVVLHDGVDPRWADSVTDALGRFETAGLEAFPVEVHVWTASDSTTRCRDHKGWFSAPETGPRVDLCLTYHQSDLGTGLRHKLVLHELAHAWIHTHVTDTTRQAFLDSLDIEGWNDHTHAHASRGTEIAADAVMYTLHPDEPANDTQTCGYELITNHPTPFGRTDKCAA